MKLRPMAENDKAALGEAVAGAVAALIMTGTVFLLDRILKKRAAKAVAQKDSSK